MKQKIVLSICIVGLLLCMLVPINSFAISSKGGYSIESYDVQMIVNENNTFDIIETIKVEFTESGKHGIFRKIPLKNTVTRLDGTESKNRAKISNISVSDKYTTTNEDGYKVLKIGDKNQTVFGKKTYVIKYNYNIGKDPLQDVDELYFNLVGEGWDIGIPKTTFSIIMPKSFDQSKLGFSSGNKGVADSTNVNYTVEGNKITGSLEKRLYPGQALTVRLALPEGYFVGASDNFDYMVLVKIGISIIFVVIAFALWCKYGKDDMVVDTVEFYPPEGMNSAELGFIYKGKVEQKDIISLLIYLANKGYLKIEQKSYLMNFKIIKLKEYDGNNENEKTFFNELFKETDEVTRSDLYDNFYLTLDKIEKNINKKENREIIFEKTSLRNKLLLVIMIFIVFLFMGGLSIFKIENISSLPIIGFMLLSPFVMLYKTPNIWNFIFCSFDFGVITFLCMAEDIALDKIYFIMFIIEYICLILLFIFLGIMKKRTKYGTEMLGKIKGFKEFLEKAEKPQLEELVMREPEYFYNILPYTYVLGVSSKWIKQFEDIALQAPSWYYSYNEFDNHSFNMFMNSTYSLISSTMSSKMSGSNSSGGGYSGGGYSGGGYSGGGFSGGGSGGGGGGSW